MATVAGAGVLFDLDDTLLDHAGAAADAVRSCAARWGLGSQHCLVGRWRGLERHFYRRFQAGELTLHEQRRARIRAFLDEPDLADEQADGMFDQFWAAYRRQWRLFADAAPVLDAALASGLSVGVLTNGERAHQALKWTETGLARPGIRLVASSELPAAKPRAIAYHATCRLLGVPADTATTMIGDSWENDVEGAVEAGLGAIHLDRARPGGIDGPVERVQGLADITFVRRPAPAPGRAPGASRTCVPGSSGRAPGR